MYSRLRINSKAIVEVMLMIDSVLNSIQVTSSKTNYYAFFYFEPFNSSNLQKSQRK